MSAHNPDNVSRHQGFYTPKKSEQAAKDLYWCPEGCGFVDANHRCEQWCNLDHIPKEAVKAILDSQTQKIKVDAMAMDVATELMEVQSKRIAELEKEIKFLKDLDDMQRKREQAEDINAPMRRA